MESYADDGKTSEEIPVKNQKNNLFLLKAQMEDGGGYLYQEGKFMNRSPEKGGTRKAIKNIFTKPK